MRFDKEQGKMVMKDSPDLDGEAALSILKSAGFDISDLVYVKPGDKKDSAINLDTGDKMGVSYEKDTGTAYFDHHEKSINQVTSTADIVYKTLVEMNMLQPSESMEKAVDFVTKIDNRKFAPEEFLKSSKTMLGLQRDVSFDNLVKYFEDHESETEELTPEDFKKYGLEEAAKKQEKIVNNSMKKLDEMIESGKVVETSFGKILINENNELPVGSSAAYVKLDGILNLTPGKSFAITLKDQKFDEEELKKKLGGKFQGKIIRGNMWIYNDKEELGLLKEDLINAIL